MAIHFGAFAESISHRHRFVTDEDFILFGTVSRENDGHAATLATRTNKKLNRNSVTSGSGRRSSAHFDDTFLMRCIASSLFSISGDSSYYTTSSRLFQNHFFIRFLDLLHIFFWKRCE
jgi:hypothetical protein